MNRLLFDRATGALSPEAFALAQTNQLIHGLQYAPRVRFDGEAHASPVLSSTHREELRDGGVESNILAHQSGVNVVAIDHLDQRLLLSGGADSSIKIWDLQQIKSLSKAQILKPTSSILKNSSSHKYGITQVAFYPFDTGAFLSSSYDHHLKLYATDSMRVSASFDLDSIVYTHALSHIAPHLLVACATQHPAIRLVDLRSGSSAHSLAGHAGAVLSVAWSPTREHVLASGGIDGTARVWDVRKSSGNVGMLDVEDSIGITGYDGAGLGANQRASSKAHAGAVNGVSWTDDGAYIITAGHDERVRVWEAATGRNTLASFGPTLKNSQLSTLSVMTSPSSMSPPGKGLLYYPNEHEIFVFQLHEGRLMKKLKSPGPVRAAMRSRTGERSVRNRITSLAWRSAVDGICSGHSDGQIRFWGPEPYNEDDLSDIETAEERKHIDSEKDSLKRKRQVLEDVFNDLTKQKITFG